MLIYANFFKNRTVNTQETNMALWVKWITACKDNNLEDVKNCIKHGINVNAVNINNWTGLMMACEYNNKDIVKEILKVPELDIYHKQSNGFTAWDIASRHVYMEIVHMIEEREKIIEGIEALKIQLRQQEESGEFI